MIIVTYDVEVDYQGNKPIVAVRIWRDNNFVDTEAMVDSGADYSVFSAELTDELGLRLTDGTPQTLRGIGGAVSGYLHSVGLQLLSGGATNSVRGNVFFVQNLSSNIRNLLGRHDFFRALRVGFNEARKKLYLGQS